MLKKLTRLQMNIGFAILYVSLGWVAHSALNQLLSPVPSKSVAPRLIAGRNPENYTRLQVSSSFFTNSDASLDLVSRFLWYHWTDSSPGLVEWVQCGTDAGNTNYYFVEKDAAGKWSISIYCQHYQAIENKEYPVEYVNTAYDLELFEPEPNTSTPLEPGNSVKIQHPFRFRLFDQNHQPLPHQPF